MSNFYLYNDRVIVNDQFGQPFPIYFTADSGKVYYRMKIDTISNVKHPGVYLGIDDVGTRYFIHNHYHYGSAAIVPEYEFTKGRTIHLYREKCSNSPLAVIRVALSKVSDGERYNFLTYNCQTFANQACNNQRKSESAEKWLVGALALLFIGVIASK